MADTKSPLRESLIQDLERKRSSSSLYTAAAGLQEIRRGRGEPDMLTKTRGSVPARAALLAVVGTVAAVQSASAQSWNKDANGAWTDKNNWLPVAVPNAANAAPVFGNVITDARTITLGQGVQLASMSFSTQANKGSYTISGNNALLFRGAANLITIAANNANQHNINTGIDIGTSDLSIDNLSNASLFLGGPISQNGGARKINITGGGPVFLGGNNSTTGELSINKSVVGFQTAKGLGAGNAAINLSGGAQLLFTQPVNPPNPTTETVVKPITLAGADAIRIGSDPLQPNLTLDLSGVMSGNAPVTFSGSTSLLNNNTFTGTVRVEFGTLRIGSDKSLGAAANKLVLNFGGLLALNNLNSARAIELGQSIIDTNGKSVTLSGVIKDEAGIGMLSKTGAGTLTLSGTNTFKSEVSLKAGTLSIAKTANLGTGTLVSFNGGTLQATDNITLAQTFGVSAAGGSVEVAAGKTLEVAAIRNAGPANGGTLVKIGAGQLDVTGNVGQALKRMDVNAGTLGLAGAGVLDLVDGLFINNAKVAGKGKVTGPIQFVSKAKVKPGNSPGTLTFEGPTLFIGGNEFEIDLNAATGTAGADIGWGLLNVQSSLTFSGASPLDPMVVSLRTLDLSNNIYSLADFNPAQDYSWTFAVASGGIVGFDSSAWIVDSSRFHNQLLGGSFSVVQFGNELQVRFTAVPAPAGLSVIGIAGVMATRRRRA
jgi:autotransporter-associated beta strand protein